tara:strand:+ start:362 stop:628 length:267 start_codon:yes stop_codon:yes gene_type:complete
MERAEKSKIWLYKNDYKTKDNHPVKTGNGEIPKEALRAIVEKFKREGGDTVKIKAAAWEKVSKSGTPYLFVTIEPDEKADGKPDEVPF